MSPKNNRIDDVNRAIHDPSLELNRGAVIETDEKG
jgi:hypothetical protein